MGKDCYWLAWKPAQAVAACVAIRNSAGGDTDLWRS